MNVKLNVGRFDAYWRQFTRYWTFFVWFVKDVFNRDPRRIIYLSIANILGVLCQLSAVYLCYRYAHSLESGVSIGVLGVHLDPRTSSIALVATAIVALVLLSSSAILITQSRVWAIRLARRYSDFCSQRIAILVSSRLSVVRTLNAPVTGSRVTQLILRDAHYCGIVVRALTYALLPAVTVFFSGMFLFVSDLSLSLVVSAILAGASVYLYHLNVEGASKRALLERTGRRMKAEKMRVANRVAYFPAPISSEDSDLKSIYACGATNEFGNALEGQRSVLERSYLVSQIAMGLAVFSITLMQGAATLRQESDWSHLLAYLVAFSFFATSFAKTIRILTSVNRVYPVISRYGRFVQSIQKTVIEMGTGKITRFTLHAVCLDDPSRRTLEIHPGSRIGLVLPRTLSRYEILGLANGISAYGETESIDRDPQIWFACGWSGPFRGTLRDLFGFPDHCQLTDLRVDLDSIGLWDHLCPELPSNMDSELNDKLHPISSRAVYILSALAGLYRECHIIVLEEGILATIEAQARDRFLRLFPHQLLCIAYTRDALSSIGSYGETSVLVHGDRQLGWTSIAAFGAVRNQIENMLSVGKRSAKRQAKQEFTEEASDLDDFM